MSAAGGNAQLIVQIRTLTEALSNLRDVVNDNTRNAKDLGAAGEGGIASIKASRNSLTSFAKDAMFGSVQGWATQVGAGQGGEIGIGTLGESAAEAIGRAGMNIPIIGDLYARNFAPINNAKSRVSAINANYARAGGSPAPANITRAMLEHAVYQEERAAEAVQDVGFQLKEMSLYGDALEKTGRSMWRIGLSPFRTLGLVDDDLPKQQRRAGMTQR